MKHVRQMDKRMPAQAELALPGSHDLLFFIENWEAVLLDFWGVVLYHVKAIAGHEWPEE